MSGSILSILNEQQKEQLFLHQRTIACAAGEILFNQNEPANQMFLVERGKVSLFRLMPNGDEKLFKVFLAGELIAEMAMFMSPRVYPMSVRADQDSQLAAFGYEAITKLVYGSPELSVKVMGYMSNKIASLMNTVNILTQVNANQRLVMKLAELYQGQVTKEEKITLPITKKLLATQLGMTPETLSRAITKLKTEGLLVESGNSLALVDIPRLCQSVNLTPDIFA